MSIRNDPVRNVESNDDNNSDQRRKLEAPAFLARAKTNTITSDVAGKKRKKHAKTLGSLLRYFEGMELVVELKSGRMYRGTLSASDESMNLTLDTVVNERQVTGSRQQGENQDADASKTDEFAKTFPSLHVRGSTIRFIHFPDSADLSLTIRRGKERERSAASMYNRGKRK